LRRRTEKLRAAALVFIGLLGAGASHSRAGDAVVVGYNSDGVWTRWTYYCSSTPKGGRDYKDAGQAREAALRDLRRLEGKLARTDVLAASDLTGYFACARTNTPAGKDVMAVGYGKSQGDADKDALDKLRRGDGTAEQKIVYRYHSYGADSAP
jgi:hypothetical protein